MACRHTRKGTGRRTRKDTIKFRTLKYVALTSTLALMMGLVVDGRQVRADEGQGDNKTVDFDMASMPLADALVEFSTRTGLVVWTAGAGQAIKDLRSRELYGRHSPAEAMDILLQDSGLSYRFRGADTVIIRHETADGDEGSLFQNIEKPDKNQYADDEKPEQEPLEFEEIVVTGSHIRGVGPVGSQVFTYDRGDIDIQGYSTLPQFMQSLPQNFGGGISQSTSGISFESQASNNVSDATGINLRGVGNVSTLVLLNGYRLAPAGRSGGFVDISLIPLTAIDRVEVLTDGASAIYGSDAVGGVVNFKLRKDYEGAETRLRYGLATEGGLDEYLFGQTFGTTWDQGHGLISYEYHHRDPLDAKDRSFSKGAPDLLQLLPEQDRHSVFLTGGHNLTENIEVFATAYYNIRNSDRIATSVATVPSGITTSETEQYGSTLGSALELGNTWRAELAGTFSRNEITRKSRNLDEAESDSNILTRRSENVSVDTKLDGSIFQMAGGHAKLAVGGHFRHETFGDLDLSIDPSLITNPIDDKDRNIYALFGEVFLPFVSEDNRMPGVERLELSVAGRYEDYSDFGSSTDPKFGMLWSPVEGLNLRGTYGTSFRAPLLQELDEGFNGGLLVNSISNPMSSTGSSAVLFMTGPGNAGLQPETATTWTAGFDLQPVAIPELNVSVTYFDIDYKDRIGELILNRLDVLDDPKFTPFIDFSPDPGFLATLSSPPFNNFTSFPGFGPPVDFTDAEVVVDVRTQNLSRNTIRGLDFSVSYGLDTEDSGNWNFSLNGTYFFDFLEQFSAADPTIDAVDTIDHPVDLRLNGGISWAYEGFTTNLIVNYVDGYLNNRDEPEATVDSWTTVNLTLSYDTEDRFGGWLDNTTFTLSAVNLFDQDPPFVTTILPNIGIFYDPSAANPEGRVLSFQITKKW